MALNITPVRLKKMMCAYFIYTCLVSQRNACTNLLLANSVDNASITKYAADCFILYQADLVDCDSALDLRKTTSKWLKQLDSNNPDFLNAATYKDPS